VITALFVCLGGVALWVLHVLRSLVEPIIAAEVRGTFDDHLTARVVRAAYRLPTELAAELEAEWLAELGELNHRPRLALRFVRGLDKAADAIAGDLLPGSIAAHNAVPAGAVEEIRIPGKRRGPAAIQREALSSNWLAFIEVAPAQEAQVLSAVFEGESTVEIAARFGIPIREVHLLRARGANRLSALGRPPTQG
jgi:DNA-directed RNA polymerase specialized sigma24 family protein